MERELLGYSGGVKSYKCITENCNNKGGSRGLCCLCYEKAKRFIKKNNLTWDDLVSKNLALESRIHKGAFFDALKKVGYK